MMPILKFKQIRCLAVLTFASLLLAVQPGQLSACSIPVFRYAIERWKPGQFEAMVFHRGPLTAEQKQALTALAGDEKNPLNLNITPIDLGGAVPDPASQRLWEQQKNATLPWLLVRSPETAADAPPAYAGPLDAGRAKTFADSPARRTLAQRLLKGDSAVWVLLESGDAKRDAAAAKLLSERLAALQDDLRLPEFADAQEPAKKANDEPGLLSNLPMKLRFSMLRVSPTDPTEAQFVQMLRHAEPELKKAVPGQPGEPIVFPVFGQGRVLCGLEGKNIRPETIEDCAAFLVGECSCQVKELNPGVDLLLAADWDSILEAHRPPEKKSEIPEPIIGSGKTKRAKPPAAPAGK